MSNSTQNRRTPPSSRNSHAQGCGAGLECGLEKGVPGLRGTWKKARVGVVLEDILADRLPLFPLTWPTFSIPLMRLPGIFSRPSEGNSSQMPVSGPLCCNRSNRELQVSEGIACSKWSLHSRELTCDRVFLSLFTVLLSDMRVSLWKALR